MVQLKCEIQYNLLKDEPILTEDYELITHCLQLSLMAQACLFFLNFLLTCFHLPNVTVHPNPLKTDCGEYNIFLKVLNQLCCTIWAQHYEKNHTFRKTLEQKHTRWDLQWALKVTRCFEVHTEPQSQSIGRLSVQPLPLITVITEISVRQPEATSSIKIERKIACFFTDGEPWTHCGEVCLRCPCSWCLFPVLVSDTNTKQVLYFLFFLLTLLHVKRKKVKKLLPTSALWH